MKHEAKFQIRGEVADLVNETYGDSIRYSLILVVQSVQDKKSQFRIGIYGDDMCNVARSCKGRHVLIVGRMSGGISKAGYYNCYLNADAILIEPSAARPAPQAPTPHQQAKANGYQPQPKPEDPLPWDADADGDDIPF